MNSDMLAENIFVPDAQLRRSSVILQILRDISDYRAGMNLVDPANGRLAGQVNVRADVAIRTDNHPRIDDCIRANLDGLVQIGLWIDDDGGMNGCSHSSTLGFNSSLSIVAGSNKMHPSHGFLLGPSLYTSRTHRVGAVECVP